MPAQTTIVLVHGWAGSAEAWEPVTRALREQPGFDVHSVRLPGSPAAASTRATIPAAAEDLIGLLRTFDRPVVLVGHSLGAQVTLRAHAAAPDLVLTEVVIDPAYGAAAHEREAMERWAAQIESEGHAAVEDFFIAASTGLSAVDIDRLHHDLRLTPASVIASYLRSEYVDTDAIGLVPASAHMAARRRQPVLALHSSDGGVQREQQLPRPEGSQIVLWPSFGHYMHLQDPERFADLLVTWVTSQPSTATAVSF